MANAGTAGRSRRIEFEPIRWPWRLLTSVRFAIGLIAFLAFAAMLGVLIPQIPAPMRGNPAGLEQWYIFQEGKFGFFTGPMRSLGFFDVFRSLWFVSGLGLLVASVCVCTANRLGPVWRNALHPQTRVSDDYFERGQPIIAVGAVDAEALAQQLRRRRYKVSLTHDGVRTYLFADRFPWAQFATFVSHLALILFLAGGFVTLLMAREQQIFVAELEPGAPVFSTTDKDHMQIYVEDAIGEFDASGFPLHFETDMVVYKNGKEVARGATTVNRPLRYGGYAFHQSAYFPDGAALQVRDLTTGRVVYDETLALVNQATTPRVSVRDSAGNELLNDLIVPTDFIGDAAGTKVSVPGQDREFWIGARPNQANTDFDLIVYELSSPGATPQTLDNGGKADFDGLSVTFLGMGAIPSVDVSNVPGSDSDIVAEISKGPSGDLLTVGPLDGQALALSPNQPVVNGNFEYTFLGRREFSGITVRRDPGSTIIWIATGVFLLGLALTFYTPRRRLWGKIANGEAAFRGLGGRSKAIEGEVRQAAQRAQSGAADAEPTSKPGAPRTPRNL
jgi:cytochrome c biogenesis protein